MRSLARMDTIQIELTSACVLRCSNCTRFCGTHKVPFFIEEELFRKAIDSLVDFAKSPRTIVGFMGGEPLLHPKFAEFCEYASTRIPREHLGLWSTFPDAPKYKKLAPLICKTFGVVLLNDHSRDDILHAPVLMAAEDYFRRPCPECGGKGTVGEQSQTKCAKCDGRGDCTDDEALFKATDNCWVQNYWSASINPKGAWFCEVAGAMAELFDGPQGWAVEPGWWIRMPKDFKAQRDWACRKCGAALPIKRVRNSQDPCDDVSLSNLVRLRIVNSRKVERGEFALHDQFEMDPNLEQRPYPDQTYKDFEYRRHIAAKYGISLRLNSNGFFEPLLDPGADNDASPQSGS